MPEERDGAAAGRPLRREQEMTVDIGALVCSKRYYEREDDGQVCPAAHICGEMGCVSRALLYG